MTDQNTQPNGEHETPSRFDEDLSLGIVSKPEDYAHEAQGELRVVPVRRLKDGETQTIGYLWSSNAEDAAGYVAVAAFGSESVNLGTPLWLSLRESKKIGDSPYDAIISTLIISRAFIAPTHDDEFSIGSLEELRALANNKNT